jgi:Thioredoxin like C-terminal domain
MSISERRAAGYRARGSDVDDQGNGAVTEPRVYQLIRQPGPVVDREIEIRVTEGSAGAGATFSTSTMRRAK